MKYLPTKLRTLALAAVMAAYGFLAGYSNEVYLVAAAAWAAVTSFLLVHASFRMINSYQWPIVRRGLCLFAGFIAIPLLARGLSLVLGLAGFPGSAFFFHGITVTLLALTPGFWALTVSWAVLAKQPNHISGNNTNDKPPSSNRWTRIRRPLFRWKKSGNNPPLQLCKV